MNLPRRPSVHCGETMGSDGGVSSSPFFIPTFVIGELAVYFEKNRSFVNRHGWTFLHTGAVLEDRAVDLYEDYKSLETEARNLAADLLRDAQIHHEDKRVISAKNDIVKYGKLREQCAVWVHEFGRTPEREFSLGINDVSFFRIFGVGGEAEPCESVTQRNNWKFMYCGRDLIAPLMNKYVKIKGSMADMNAGEKHEAKEEMEEILLLAEEFERNPDKEVNLALGDVVYLDLAPLLKRTKEQ